MFEDINDYFRAIFSIYEFNNSNPVSILKRREERARFKKETQTRVGLVGLVEEEDKRNKIVEVLAFCLMPNHIHLLVKQIVDGGVTKYMNKLGGGYAYYFKTKHDIKVKGHFYQDRFNAVHIKNDGQLQTVFTYIHTNPIALIEPGWKEKGILDPVKAKKFLEEEFRWSSYWDCLDKKNFPSVTERNFLLEVMGGMQGCKNAVDNWIDYKGEIRNIPDFVLE